MLNLKLLRSIPEWDQGPDILPEADLWYLACPNLKYPAWLALLNLALPDIHYQAWSDLRYPAGYYMQYHGERLWKPIICKAPVSEAFLDLFIYLVLPPDSLVLSSPRRTIHS